MDEEFESLLALYDQKRVYARIDEQHGLTWVAMKHGGAEDALPRKVLLIAGILQRFCDETDDAHWEMRDTRWGIVFHDEMEWLPIDDIGYNRDLGFFSISRLPRIINEASLDAG
jgi:hypothetical protein